MRERPILFSSEMVRAILEGRKTMTRRVINKNNSHCGSEKFNVLDLSKGIPSVSFSGQAILKAPLVDDDGTLHRIWPKWEVGGRLWVRETFYKSRINKGHDKPAIVYVADNENLLTAHWKKYPSIFMPRWASRITLEITNIRVERLQEITGKVYLDLMSLWAFGWDKINGKTHPWASNPWVWVIEFKKLEAV